MDSDFLLNIGGNSIASIPVDAFPKLHNLVILNIGGNSIASIPVDAFPKLHNLVILLMKRNSISDIDEDAFTNLTALRVLELDDNHLDEIPKALTKLTNLQELSVSGNRIKYIPDGILQHCKGLGLLELKGNPLVAVHPNAFAFLPKLRKLILSEARDLRETESNTSRMVFFSIAKVWACWNSKAIHWLLSIQIIKYIQDGILQHCKGLGLLELKGNPLVAVHPNAFAFLPKLRKLILSEARDLREFPSLNGTTALEVLRLDRASIYSVPSSLCSTCPHLKSLDLKSNKLTTVPDVNNCSDLRVLDLKSNKLTTVPDVNNCSDLRVLNLGNNLFPTLPTRGLERLLHLKTFNNPNLREFPEPENFPRIQTLALSYAYHCCSYLPLIPAEPPPKPSLHDSIIFPTENEFDMSLWNSSLTDIWPQLQNFSKKFGTQINTLWDTFGSDFTYPGNLPAYVEEYFEEQEKSAISENMAPKTVQCVPLPGEISKIGNTGK
ncbi:leucine-rich repeat-containing G-protein coupled receptor 6-like [Diaphorina citri]|uniref:Leucine-rich repeat-containing G-protein coupled receptor 6-like n=1 Tax=Diaphorina citri TaxID=121845 RepID=A0A3Q0J829_DIACI|nr:leucine-rich repeat-containing G-protein coupled receptor 6-like [Diaphorina citri]